VVGFEKWTVEAEILGDDNVKGFNDDVNRDSFHKIALL
jgi:hypothetical protein